MTNAHDVVAAMCERYQAAVSANDSRAYKQLFADDAIRVPPGSDAERGSEAIAASEQSDYDVEKWTIKSTPLDALAIGDDWVYGIAHVDATTVSHADGSSRSFEATKTWLLHRGESGDWQIKRQMWNLK